MSQQLLFDVPEQGIRWHKKEGPVGGTCGAWYFLICDGKETGWLIIHCGHPTANYPYYGETPNTTMIVADNGKGFVTLKEAKEKMIELFNKEKNETEKIPG